MATRVRKRGRMARCHSCRAAIKWFRWGNGWRGFEPRVIDPRRHTGPPAFPTEGRKAWRTGDLVEALMVSREISSSEARDEVDDMAWHIPHVCPPPMKKET